MSEENLENISNSYSNFAPNFADHHVLSDIIFNGHCLMTNNIISLKCNKSIYCLHTKSMVKKCKHRFYIKELLI